MLNVKSVTYAPAGSAANIFDRLGIAEQMKDKIKLNPLVRVPQVVAAGEVELAIAGIPTLLSVKGVQLVGPLPAELQSWFVNTAGVSADAKHPAAAKALIKYLATPEAATVMKAKGMEPLAK
jgi:molybdate transport system substrate-binding protein